MDSILFIIFLIFCSGYFSASETALFSLSSTKIKAYQSSPSKKKQLIASLVLKPRDLLVTVFMLNTLASILIQNTSSHMSGESASWALKVGVPFVLMLFLGEIIPKNLGLQHNIYLSDKLAPSINFLQNFIRPIRVLIVRITVPISRLLFFYLRPDKSISKEELKHVLKTSQEYGVLHPDEADLVWGFLSFQESSVKNLMRPCEDILFYNIKDPLSKLTYLFTEQKCSRLPVCKDSIDHIIGILDAHQYFLHKESLSQEGALEDYLTPPLYIPENMSAKTLFKKFNEINQRLAIVVDEYGSISGLITREDLVEEVVGDISDLRDQESLFTKAGTKEIIASGRMELDDLNDYFSTHLKSKNNMVTIGGWVTEKLGSIPKNGEKIELDNFFFQVLAADPNKIQRLYIRYLK